MQLALRSHRRLWRPIWKVLSTVDFESPQIDLRTIALIKSECEAEALKEKLNSLVIWLMYLGVTIKGRAQVSVKDEGRALNQKTSKSCLVITTRVEAQDNRHIASFAISLSLNAEFFQRHDVKIGVDRELGSG